MSQKKVQIAQKTVTYLGFEISQGERKLGIERRDAICQIAPPKSREFRRSLGMARWCRHWMPNFGSMAKPLYELVKDQEECWNGLQNVEKGLMIQRLLL